MDGLLTVYVPFTLAVVVVVYTIFNREMLGAEASVRRGHLISSEMLGSIEQSIAGLREVIVVCDHVERPTSGLQVAVERNLEAGVRYLFMVSENRAKDEVGGYFRIFEALASIVAARGAAVETDRLVEIRKLPFNWNDYPYVFYRFEADSRQGFSTVAFRGSERHEGIATSYVRVPPAFAHTIANAVLAEAPQRMGLGVPLRHEEFAGSPPLRLVRD